MAKYDMPHSPLRALMDFSSSTDLLQPLGRDGWTLHDVWSSSSNEDITSMDMTILVPSCPKVNERHIKIKFDTFEQLMLHYDFCAFSFSKLFD
jgi:hypothetical protein